MALHKTSVKIVNMRVVRLAYRVTPYFIISGAQARKSEYSRFEYKNLL